MSLNKCMFIGRLGADPEMRTTPNGAQVCNFRIAVTERWKDKDGNKQEKTEWVTCIAWRKQAEIAGKYLRKGSQVYVEGKFQTRQFEDKNGGGKRYATEIEVGEFQMLDARPSDGGGNGGGYGGGSPRGRSDDLPDMPAGVTAGDDNDLPFN